MNNRRKLVIALCASAVSAPFGSHAQQHRAQNVRIGLLLTSGDENSPTVVAFRDELRRLGWVEGKNLAIEYRLAEGKSERISDLAAELVRLKVDVVVTSNTPSALAAKAATRDIPIVFSMVSDPVASGLVTSLARPGGNLTGWSNMQPETSGKLLALLKELLPKLSRIAVLFDPSNTGKQLEIKVLQAAAQRIALSLVPLPVRELSDVTAAFSKMTQERADGLVVLQDSVTGSNRSAIVQDAARIRLPAIYQVREFVDVGGLMSYGVNITEQYRRASHFVDKILKGANPADIPIEQPTKFELVINLKAAKALSLTIPQSLLVRTDEVIQ